MSDRECRCIYTSETDIMYISVGDSSEEYESEVVDDVSVFRDMNTEEITGFMIMDYKEKLREGRLPDLPYGYRVNINQESLV